MEQKPKIILERIVRALISMIPIVGSPLEQLSFGLKDSFENKELLEKVALIENSIRKLTAEGLTRDLILHEIRQSEAFGQAERLIAGEYLVPGTQSVTIRQFDPGLATNLLENRKNLQDVEKKVRELEKEQQKIYHQINHTIDLITEVKSMLSAGRQSFDFEVKKAQVIQLNAQKLGSACQVSLKKNLRIVIPPAYFRSYLDYPLVQIDEEAVFMTYLMQKKSLNRNWLENDSVEYHALLKFYLNPDKMRGSFANRINDRIFTRQKFTSLFGPSNPPWEDEFPESLLNEQKNHKMTLFSETFRRDLIDHPNKIKHIYSDALRLLRLEELSQNAAVVTMMMGHNRDREIYQTMREKGLISDLEKQQVITSAEILALASFFKLSRTRNKDIIALHRLFANLKNRAGETEMRFDDLAQLNEFLSDISLLEQRLRSFKDDLRKKVLYPLYSEQEQLRLINASYLDFFQAYGDVEHQIKKALAIYQQQLEFN